MWNKISKIIKRIHVVICFNHGLPSCTTSPQSSSGCGGTHTSHLRSTSVCWNTVQGGSQPHPSGRSLEMGRGQRHSWCCIVPLFVPSLTMDALCMDGMASNTNLRQLDSIHNSGLRLAFGSILHQPSVQPVHRGQRSSFGGTSVKAVHALLCENSCLHWQSSISCPAWIWPNH